MNRVIITGNLTHDPELRTTASGVSTCSFRVAVNRRFKDKDGNATTDFIQVVTWRKTAELCADYLGKGKKVLVIGELQNRSYETKDGTKKTVTEIVADEVEFLSPKSDGNENSGRRGRNKQSEPDMDGFMDISDDELPFG